MRTKTIARWRRAALAGALATTLALPAVAQEQPAPKPEEMEGPGPKPDALEQPAQPPQKPQKPQRGENAPVITEQSPRPPPDLNIKPVPGTPEEYVIVKGDTLWDLSQKFLNNPWYWPKIWSLNPSIENPHWIYPGNKLRIVPGEGGVQAPAQVEEGAEAASAEPQPEAVEPGVTPVSPDFEVVKKGGRLTSNNTVSVSGKLAFTPPPVVTVRTSGLVSPEEVRHAGRIDASFEEKQMLATYDTAYVRFRREVPAKPGDKLVIFRPDGEIRHPFTNRKLADKTRTLGIVNVLTVTGNQATVQLERVFEEIERGDLVKPYTAQDKRLTPRANTADVQGVIISSLTTGLTTYGEAHEVFIDKGSADGVQEGNTFAVVRRGDGLSNSMVVGSYTAGPVGEKASRTEMPDENVGLLLVTDTKEHISSALVIKSVRELAPGDHVEMWASGSGGGEK
jgi:hypothetical protein